MSPELNGNNLPQVHKQRKKTPRRQHAANDHLTSSTMPSAATFYHQYHCAYPIAAPTYHAEPMSLPIYHYNQPPPPPSPLYRRLNGPATAPAMVLLKKNHNNNKKKKKQLQKVEREHDECVSLPVVIDDVADGGGQRRYSDPGLPNDSDLEEDAAAEVDEEEEAEEGASSSDEEQDGGVLRMLTHQVNVLQDSNRQLMRELTELRVELNLVKQQQQQQSVAGGGGGFERDYEPGMISDFIKEIRDAARIREDALLAKVKHMVEEKQFNTNQFQLASEKTRHNERIAKLEEQIKTLSVGNHSSALGLVHNSSLRLEDNISLQSLSDDNNSSAATNHRQVCELEREVLQLRREVQESRAKKEESDQKIYQLERRLSALLVPHQHTIIGPLLGHRRDSSGGGGGDAEKSSLLSVASTATLDNLSMVSSTSPSPLHHLQHQHHRFTQVGPVTDL